MICLECIHSIIRVINNPSDETFVVCSLDGKLMTPSLVKCSRFEQPVFRAEVKEETVIGKKAGKR